MNKVISKIKNYKPSKHICFLYFFIPIFLCFCINITRENDIWFLLNHGKYVLNNGFPTIEPFSMHQNLSFVMQQWLSAVIFYLSYKLLKQYGLMLIMVITNCLILYFLYKLCMLLSENRYRISIVISCITDMCILPFILPRPWIFTMLNLVIVLYIMELFYKNRQTNTIYFLPLISMLQINLQSSMWLIIFLFMLPYIVCLIIDKIKNKKEKQIYKLFIITFIMFIIGFINPYGIDNILYVFNSYGNTYINMLIVEMFPPTLKFFRIGNSINLYGCLFYVLLFVEFGICTYYKKGRLQLRHLLLLLGVSILGLSNIRNLFMFVIGTIPFFASYLKNYFRKPKKEENIIQMNKNEKHIYIITIVMLIIYSTMIGCYVNKDFTSQLEKGIDKILESNKLDEVIVYTNYNNGSYAEYRGLKPYIDSRAEVFLKSNNKKEDIFREYYLLYNGYLKYEDFVNKYNFTHMIIMKTERIYKDACNDDNYKVIYERENYKVFERIKE